MSVLPTKMSSQVAKDRLCGLIKNSERNINSTHPVNTMIDVIDISNYKEVDVVSVKKDNILNKTISKTSASLNKGLTSNIDKANKRTLTIKNFSLSKFEWFNKLEDFLIKYNINIFARTQFLSAHPKIAQIEKVEQIDSDNVEERSKFVSAFYGLLLLIRQMTLYPINKVLSINESSKNIPIASLVFFSPLFISLYVVSNLDLQTNRQISSFLLLTILMFMAIGWIVFFAKTIVSAINRAFMFLVTSGNDWLDK